MAKEDKHSPRRLDPDDVLAGRGKAPSARELIELIRTTNPTGLELSARDMERRYARKARLQSLLVDRFADDLEVEPEDREPGVIGLRYRPLDLHACHVPLDALEVDARAWAQAQLDHRAFDSAHSPAVAPLGKRGGDSRGRPFVPDRAASPAAAEPSVMEQIRLGQEAIDAYDYDLGRTHLARALTLSAGDVEAALPLLTLLVDHLAADADALSVEAQLSPAARKHPDARLLLGLAAARAGQRERARGLLDGHRGARSVEPFLVLARAALASGDVDAVAHDLAAVRERDPIHPQLRDLEGALAARRAQERMPLEAELTGLLEGGHVEDAELRARALLARFPDSEVGRRVLRTIDELRRATQIQKLLAEAEEAAARADLALALALLGQALAAGPRGEQLAPIHARVEEIKATLRERAEHAEVEKAAALLDASDRLPGLLAYLALAEPLRVRVRARVDLPHFTWLSEIGSGERPRAAALAVVALERASALVEGAPQAALDRIEEHAKTLHGVGHHAAIELEARARLGALRREAAARRVEEARICFEEGAFERADALLAPDLLGDLAKPARASAEGLRARVAHAQEGRLLKATFENRRREGAILQARDTVDAILAREGEPERARWAAMRGEVETEIRTAFRVRIDTTPRPMTSLRHIDVEGANGLPRLVRIGTPTIPLVQTWGKWVFVRLIDLHARTEQARILLSTPVPLHAASVDMDKDRLVVLGKLGAVLELDFIRGEILGWYEGAERREPPVMMGEVDTSIHADLVENGVIVPGTRLVWRVVEGVRKRSVHILDLARRRIIRTVGDSMGRVYLDPIFARREPLIAVVNYDEETLTFHDLRGTPLGDGKLSLAAIPYGIVAEPHRERIVIFTGARPAKKEAARTPVQWCTFAPGVGASPEQLVPGIGDGDCNVVSDPASGLFFVRSRAEKDNNHLNELHAFRLEDSDSTAAAHGPGAPLASLEPLYRVPVAVRATLVQSDHRQDVTVLVPTDDDFDLAPLGPEPPQLRSLPPVGTIQLKILNSFGTHCHKPTGARQAAVTALVTAMRHEPRSAWARRSHVLQQEGDAVRMIELGFALEELDEPIDAGNIGNWANRKFPDHPEVRVGEARPIAGVAQWSKVRDLLVSVNPSGLDGGTARHLHHLLGQALLNLGEPEQARRALERCAEYPDGTCDVSALLALATPLSESFSAPGIPWTPEQLALREVVAAVEVADACLDRGDAASALRALDRLVVTEAGEVQSLARRAESVLRVEDAGEEGVFEKACVLAQYCAAHAEKKPYLRREIPIPCGRWATARLDDIAARASQWLTATLGEPSPQRAGGL